MQPAVFVAFGVAFGNIEREPSERVPMDDLCQAWNKALRDNQIQIQLVHWYRHTGNFVLYGIGMDVKRVSDSLESISKRKFAVFPWDAFVTWIEAAKNATKSPPPPVPGRRWTPGMVMDTDPSGPTPPHPAAAEPICVGSLAQPRLRFVWRNDLLIPGTDKLDKGRREGGWGKVAYEMQREAGGCWTARALSSGDGLLRSAAELPSKLGVAVFDYSAENLQQEAGL